MANSYQKLPSLDYEGDQVSEVTDMSQLINDTVNDPNQRASNGLEMQTKYNNYCCNHRVEKHKTDSYRKGPAPIEDAEALKKSVTKATYGTLDSDVEDLEFEEVRKNGSAIVDTNPYNKVKAKTNAKGDSLASCRALIVYFSKLAKTKDEDETVDLNFVDSLLQNGADINFPDKHGQTIMHEISRGWHPDVAQFALQNGADLNKADGYGRTPLHLAAAVDYDDMVEFLVQNGANLGAKTHGENQTPMHYAAKNNAAASLKIMLRLGAHINDRDYKGRTPLFVAAETARADAARYLIEQGAPAGVYDSSGTTCLSLMIEKMPQIAIEAVEQFHLLDRAFRKHYYYLSHLEPDPKFLAQAIPESKRERKEQKERIKEEKRLMKEQGKKVKKQKTYAKTPLEVIVQYNQLDLVMHPVFQRLLHVKWNLFSKWGAWLSVLLNLFYTLIWTFLGIFIPRGAKLNYYQPFSENWWRLVLEVIGLALTVYFIFMEISQVRIIEKVHNRWRQWRTRHVEKDLQYCHPRWPEERKYLESELAQIRTYQRTYFREPWNIFEWIAYFVVLTLAITRVLSVASDDKTAENIHPRIYSLGLIVIWLRFMRSCRAFRSLGPFIAILGSVIADTMKFAFLFFEFFIPYVVGFWILFGGSYNGDKMGENRIDWEEFNNLVYSVWSMTLMGDFNFDGLVAVDRLMAQILCGTYFALAGVICMNLYIALLSDTFARVYSQAQANAVMQLAQTTIMLEGKLNKEKRLKFAHYVQNECSPEEVYSRDEGNLPDDHDNDLFEKVTRHIVNRIDEMEDNMKRATGTSHHGANPPGTPGFGGAGGGGDFDGGGGGPGGNLMPIFKRHDKQIDDVKKDLGEIKHLLQKLAKVPPTQMKQPPQVNHPPSYRDNFPPPQVASNPVPYPQPTPGYQQPTPGYPQPTPGYPPQRPRGAGYMSEPEYAYPPPVVQGRGRKKRRGGKASGSGYDSDNYSVQSEMVPKHRVQRPRSPESIKSMPAGNKKRKNKKNHLTGSWEDIRADLNA